MVVRTSMCVAKRTVQAGKLVSDSRLSTIHGILGSPKISLGLIFSSSVKWGFKQLP